MAITLNGSAGVTTNSGAVYDGLQRGTAVASTSGTSIDFTGIPSWVKRITVMFNGVSTNGTSIVQVQLGTSGGFTTTGYNGTTGYVNNTNVTNMNNISTGLGVGSNNSSTDTRNGICTITNLNGNIWTSFALIGLSAGSSTGIGAGSVSLSGTLDRIRITTVNGTDTFDAGSINILYE